MFALSFATKGLVRTFRELRAALPEDPKKGAFIDRNRHCVICSAHPSPLSAYRGFFGNHHFSLANAYLTAHGQQPVVW